MAQKLLSKKAEWGVDQIQIFVKVRNPENEQMLTPAQRKSIIPFGNEAETIFALDAFFNNRLEEMAMKKHYLNALIKSRTGGNNITGDQKEIEIHSLYEWHLYDSDKKLSSVYSILSQRMKLQLMGLDYRERKQQNGTKTLVEKLRDASSLGLTRQISKLQINEETSEKPADDVVLPDNNAYFERYAGDDRPVIDESIKLSEGMEVYKYEKRLTEDDFKHQTRKNLAIQEHSRWNAYMISRGFIPATRAQILKDKDGKDYDLRYHGNLTTMKGLIEFRELTTE